jgi:hypothetical protein
MTDNVVVQTKETDYLDEYKPIRGQNYVCLSFISPEDVLVDKDVYLFSRFLDGFSTQLDGLLTSLKNKYPDDESLINVIRENNSHLFDVKEMQEQFKFFKGVNSYELESEFLKLNNFKTSMRGIKVRGVFDTLKEAQTRAEVLKRMGDKFDIYVGTVGCWCPWSPNPEDLEDQEYAESTLNTLMKKYKENQQSKDEVYEKRKQEKLETAQRELEKKKKELEDKKAADEAATTQQSIADAINNATTSFSTQNITDATADSTTTIDTPAAETTQSS